MRTQQERRTEASLRLVSVFGGHHVECIRKSRRSAYTVIGGCQIRPTSVLPKMLRNDPDRLILSAVDDFTCDPADVEVFHL